MEVLTFAGISPLLKQPRLARDAVQGRLTTTRAPATVYVTLQGRGRSTHTAMGVGGTDTISLHSQPF